MSGADPPPKQYCGKRLANSALALEYGRDVAWRSPSFASQVASAAPPSVKISLSDVSAAGLRDDVYPFNYLGGAFNCSAQAGKCAWAELLLADGSWVNATLSLAGGSALTLTASPAPAASAGAPLASRYGWGAVPMLSLYDRGTGLPVLPWYENITAGKARDGGRAAAAATVAAAEAKEAEAVAAVTAGVDCHASRFPGLCCTSRPSEQTCLAANCRWSHEGCNIEQEDRATCSAIGDCGKAYEACCAGPAPRTTRRDHGASSDTAADGFTRAADGADAAPTLGARTSQRLDHAAGPKYATIQNMSCSHAASVRVGTRRVAASSSPAQKRK